MNRIDLATTFEGKNLAEAQEHIDVLRALGIEMSVYSISVNHGMARCGDYSVWMDDANGKLIGIFTANGVRKQESPQHSYWEPNE